MLTLEEYTRITDNLNSYNIGNEVYEEVYEGHNAVSVEINWGDWKHDHRCCDWIMAGLGYDLIDAEVTEEDGSDCYSAIRRYKRRI